MENLAIMWFTVSEYNMFRVLQNFLSLTIWISIWWFDEDIGVVLVPEENAEEK